MPGLRLRMPLVPMRMQPGQPRRSKQAPPQQLALIRRRVRRFK
ncbi:unnamed protein product [Clonostachys rosea f. rosea IK726]|uniref:Uncharacterized protein n=1 Tax=Clonostachys rosea f. rosea IK726 TaxID=1349383 RepID=A0ACA9UCC7_BIOOC|nr:unnamed protein product [Clonostachys rosea f. rosea IK726]